MIVRSGERGSGISVLAARHDDDDDDEIGFILLWVNIYFTQCKLIFYNGKLHNLHCLN